MDATSKALCHTKVEEIRRRISEGELTAQQIHDILISEIENELSRPTKEVNMAYVKICEELLSSLGADDEPLVDQYYISNRRSIRKTLEKSHFSRRRLPKFKLVTAFCLTAAMLFAVILIPNGKIEITPSADDEQYIIQGYSIQSGTNGIANAGPALDHLGSYDTTDWQEVVYLMGGKPQTPQWIPEGWNIQKYNIDLTELFSCLSINYSDGEEKHRILYTIYIFFDIDNLYDSIEKDENGSEQILANGKKVYISDNLNNQNLMWVDDRSEFILSGNTSKEYLIHMAESIQ